MANIVVHGLANCDTVRKARRWLDARGLDYRFCDFRTDGVTQEQVAAWIDDAGLDTILNRRGTTWRTLSDEDKARADGHEAVSLLVQHPSMIKRPVVEHGDAVLVGFKEETWDAHFS